MFRNNAKVLNSFFCLKMRIEKPWDRILGQECAECHRIVIRFHDYRGKPQLENHGMKKIKGTTRLERSHLQGLHNLQRLLQEIGEE